MTYHADFYDRHDPMIGEVSLRVVHLRCRPCGYVIEFGAESGREPSYVYDHEGEHLSCPGCGLDSRIPTVEESEWPNRKDRGDPMRGVPTTERAR